MSDFDQLQHKQTQSRDDEVVSPRAPAEHTGKPNDEGALTEINRILRDGRDYELLPDYFAVLPEEERTKFLAERMKDLKKVPGKLAIEIAQMLGADPAQTVKTALAGKPPATAKELHAYVMQLDGTQLATITGDDFTKLKAALPGPLLTVIPSVSMFLTELSDHAEFMKWFIETTPSPIAATLIAQHATPWMAQIFDQENLWTEWVNHLRPAGVDAGTRLRLLASGTTDKQIKAKLDALSPEPKDDATGKATQASHANDVKDELAGKPTLEGLLEAIGEAGRVEAADRDKLVAKLQKLGATADDLLYVATTVTLDPSTMLRALASAPGVRAEHLTAYLIQKPSAAKALADDKLRSTVTKTASDLRLVDLARFADTGEFHALLVTPANDGLRNWFLDDASPKDRLWFVGYDPKATARATRWTEKRVGMEWVKELTSADDGTQLRVLANHLKGGPLEDFIRTVLLGDDEPDKDASSRALHGAQEGDERAYGGDDERLEKTLSEGGIGLVQMIADLSEGKKATLRKDQAQLKRIGESLRVKSQWVRVADHLNLSYENAIAACPGALAGGPLLSYLRERPQAEELAALADPQIVEHAAQQVHPNLLYVFPALNDPKHLAKALKQNKALLGLLLEGSDPNLLASLLARDEVIELAADRMADNIALLEKLPQYKHMTKRGQQAFDKITKKVDDEVDRSFFEDQKAGDADHDKAAAQQGEQLHEADEKKTLVEKIQALGKKHDKRMKSLSEEHTKHDATAPQKRKDQQDGASVNVLALLEMHRSEVPDLLTDRTLREHTDKIRELTNMSPDVAIPWLSPTELVQMPNSLRWWLSYGDGLAVLRHLEGSRKARLQVIGGLMAETGGAGEWLYRLPKGMALEESDARVIDKLVADAPDDTIAFKLFETRFGFPPASEFSTGEVKEVYKIMSRLPRGHVMQGRIAGMVQKDLPDADGKWDSTNRRIEIDDNTTPGSDSETFHSSKLTEFQTKPELMARYGFDETRWQELENAKRIEIEDPAAKVPRYRIKEDQVDSFTQVVLHEVGHAVDEILGKRTDPVYGYANWRVHDIHAGFDNWANEMGGWDEVSTADKKKIKEAVIDASKAEVTVQELVSSDHPALDTSKYSRVGLVKHLRAGESFKYTEQVKHGDRVFIVNGYYDELFSLNADAAEVAPSSVALYAPAEYFAECYVEYYRGVDGKAGSSARKGGALAGPVKSWFDSHVDKIRFDPSRFGRKEEPKP